MTDTKTIVSAVLIADDKELVKIRDAVNQRHDELEARKRLSFSIDDPVTFTSSNRRRRGVIRGTVIGHGSKNVKVRASDGVTWTVSPGLLKHDNGTKK